MQLKATPANILNAIGLFVIIYLGSSLFNTVARNYSLGNQMTDLNKQITQLKDERDTLSYQIEYDKTESFQEREARAKLGLQLPGENVVILPKHTPVPQTTTAKTTPKKSNLQQWVDFLSGLSES